jgi:hypothetical protein
MSVEDRLRAGLRAEATSLAPAPLERHLDAIHRRVRIRSRTRWTARVAAAGAAAAAVLAVAVVATDRLAGSDADPADLPTAPVSRGAGDLRGEYVVDVPASPQGDRLGVSGRWVVRVNGDGTLDLTAPAGGADGSSDASLSVDGDRVVTNALHGVPGCQAGTGVGTYSWSVAGDDVAFAPIGEDCRARTLLFTSTWRRLP